MSTLLLWLTVGFWAEAENCAVGACEKGAVVDVIDVDVHRVVGEIPLGGVPEELALSHDGARLYVWFQEGACPHTGARKPSAGKRDVAVFDAGTWENVGAIFTRLRRASKLPPSGRFVNRPYENGGACVYDGEINERVCFHDVRVAKTSEGAYYEVLPKENAMMKYEMGNENLAKPVVLPTGLHPNAAATVGTGASQEVWACSGAAGDTTADGTTNVVNVFNTKLDVETDTDLFPDNGITPINLAVPPASAAFHPTDMAVADFPIKGVRRVYTTMFDSGVVLVYDALETSPGRYQLAPNGVISIGVNSGPRRIAIQPIVE